MTNKIKNHFAKIVFVICLATFSLCLVECLKSFNKTNTQTIQISNFCEKIDINYVKNEKEIDHSQTTLTKTTTTTTNYKTLDASLYFIVLVACVPFFVVLFIYFITSGKINNDFLALKPQNSKKEKPFKKLGIQTKKYEIFDEYDDKEL